MRIVDVKAYPLRASIPEALGSAQGLSRERSACLVEVITDEGLSGWGEAGAGRGHEVLVPIVERHLRPLVVGEDPSNVNRLWEKMYGSLCGAGRAAGMAMQALSGVDIALWDLRGKMAGLPVYELLGGKIRDSVMAYATGFYYRDNEDAASRVEEEALGYLAGGFGAMKMKIGGLPLQADARRIRTVREAIGPDIGLMIDANQAYTVAAARDLGQRVADCEIGWFEEPLPAHDLQGYLQLKAGLPIPIAAGECLYTRFGFREWCSQRALDVAQPDLCNAGGFTECARIASLTNAWGILCTPHAWGTMVTLAASLHLALTLPAMTYVRAQLPLVHLPALEWDQSPNPLREELGPLPFSFRNGFLTPNGRPGLGVEIDREALKRFLVE